MLHYVTWSQSNEHSVNYTFNWSHALIEMRSKWKGQNFKVVLVGMNAALWKISGFTSHIFALPRMTCVWTHTAKVKLIVIHFQNPLSLTCCEDMKCPPAFLSHVKDKHNGALGKTASDPAVGYRRCCFFRALGFPAAILCLDLTHRWSCDLSVILLWE